jgi:iron-sulfur cluster assembly protein
LTHSAIDAIRNLVAGADDSDILGIRIAVCGSGCGGLSYQMGLEAQARDGDAVIHCGDVLVFVDEESKPLLEGACVDFCESPTATGFVFDNPNTCGSCGIRRSCGGRS